ENAEKQPASAHSRFAAALAALYRSQILIEAGALRRRRHFYAGTGQRMQDRRAHQIDIAEFQSAFNINIVGQADDAVFKFRALQQFDLIAVHAEFDAIGGQIDDARFQGIVLGIAQIDFQARLILDIDAKRVAPVGSADVVWKLHVIRGRAVDQFAQQKSRKKADDGAAIAADDFRDIPLQQFFAALRRIQLIDEDDAIRRTQIQNHALEGTIDARKFDFDKTVAMLKLFKRLKTVAAFFGGIFHARQPAFKERFQRHRAAPGGGEDAAMVWEPPVARNCSETQGFGP